MSTKLKNILSEIKWEGRDIEIGKVYTFKDIPPFKTQTQIKEEEEKTDPIRKWQFLNFLVLLIMLKC